MKITRIVGVGTLIVFLIGVSIVASHDVAFAREDGQSENQANSAHVVNRAFGDEQSNALITAADDEGDGRTGNVTANTAAANYDGEDEYEGISSNVTASGNHGGRGNDDRNQGDHIGSRSRQPVPPVVTPPPVNPPPTSSNATLISYSAVIQPILNQRCNSCHPKPGVNLSTYAGTKAAVSRLPGMGQGYLSSAELQSLMNWIKQGALNN